MADKPNPEQDFSAFTKACVDEFFLSLPENPTPEFWVQRSANRLERFVQSGAPRWVIEKEKRILQKRVAGLPVYCPDFVDIE